MIPMARVSIALAKREFLRFLRQPQRVVGALAQPLMFWAFLGAGMGTSFQPPGMGGMSYLEYFYPGVMVMMLLFASIFSCITIIEDRDAGFLQGVLVAPVNRLSIVTGKVLGSVLIALVQTLVFTLAAPFLGLSLSFSALVLLLLALVVTATGFASLGFLLAWGAKTTSGFHAIMMVLLFPLWMLSGALFPTAGAAAWINVVMQINPVYHALNIIRAPFYNDGWTILASGDYQLSWAVTLAWAVLCIWASARRVSKRAIGV